MYVSSRARSPIRRKPEGGTGPPPRAMAMDFHYEPYLLKLMNLDLMQDLQEMPFQVLKTFETATSPMRTISLSS